MFSSNLHRAAKPKNTIDSFFKKYDKTEDKKEEKKPEIKKEAPKPKPIL